MKGLAHIGALKALKRYGIEPDEYVGTSVGSLVAAMAAGGMTPSEIEAVALGIRRKDVLDFNWLGFLFRWGRVRSLYRGKALHDFVRRTLPVDSFDRLPRPLYITSVQLDAGREVVWGMPGYTGVPIHDCVMASCAVPGLFPPKKINRFFFVDGSLVDSLPVKVSAYNKANLIVAVFLEPEAPPNPVRMDSLGPILEQAQSILSRTLAWHNLHRFAHAPVVLVQPKVAEHGMFEFSQAAEVIREGERAMEEVLRTHPLVRDLVSRPGKTPLPFSA